MPATPDELLEEILRLCRLYSLARAGEVPVGLTLRLPSGGKLAVPVPAVPLDLSDLAAPRAAPPGPAGHAEDFSEVCWPGLGQFRFAGKQREVVRLLWEAADDGRPEVPERELLDAAGSDGDRLRDLFRNHPAMRTLIVRGEAPGTYRLAPGV